jgi:type IV pilus assembly protein PilX
MAMLNKQKQEGIVLFMSLVMLLLLTVLGVSSIQTTSLQQRMARNANDGNLAFQAAELALKDGENLLQGLNSLIVFGDAGAPATLAPNQANGYYYEAGPGLTPNWLRPGVWNGAAPFSRVSNTAMTGVNAQPRYIVEHVKTVITDADTLNLDNIGQDTGGGRTEIFRVTARGTGATETAQAMIQGTYGKRF